MATPADADHEWSKVCNPDLSILVELPPEPAFPLAFVTWDEPFSHEYVFSLWVYAEANGVHGLQRHDDYCYDPGFEDDADQLIF